MLDYYFDKAKYDYEICIDEVGRGCMFGDVVVSSTILPKTCNFDISNIKDSKKFTSKKKLIVESENIKSNVLHHHTSFMSNKVVDEINILQAVMQGMRECIKHSVEFIESMVAKTSKSVDYDRILLLIDGNYFTPYVHTNGIALNYETVKQGDGKYVGIAAASIVAKSTRDAAVSKLCEEYPLLSEYYNLDSNVGYGSKRHIDGIKEHGITTMHRKTFGICKTSKINDVLCDNIV
jgi:ribonuclease HII